MRPTRRARVLSMRVDDRVARHTGCELRDVVDQTVVNVWMAQSSAQALCLSRSFHTFDYARGAAAVIAP
jgi:hypothetical protein